MVTATSQESFQSGPSENVETESWAIASVSQDDNEMLVSESVELPTSNQRNVFVQTIKPVSCFPVIYLFFFYVLYQLVLSDDEMHECSM